MQQRDVGLALLAMWLSFFGDIPAATAEPQSAADRADAAGLQEVVVTANKRSESLDQVPIAVTALSASSMDRVGISDVSSLQEVVPGLEFPRNFDGATPAIRGIGSAFGIGATESVVALYIDDVYIAQPSATTFSFNNLSQVEVLKGPQGTIFGRNAMAGVIDIHTAQPSHESSADISLGTANYNTWSGNFYGTTEITPTLAADMAVMGANQGEGWGRNLFDGAEVFRSKDFGARSKWLWTPDGQTRVTAAFDLTETTYNQGVAMRPVAGSLFPNGQQFQGYYNINADVLGVVRSRQVGASLKIERDLPFGQLVSITAHRYSRADVDADEDQSTDNSQHFIYVDGGKTWSQEFRLISNPTTQLHIIGGLFYFSNDAALDPFAASGTVFAPLAKAVEGFHQLTRSYAAFGQATQDLPLGFHLTVGGRYTKDTVNFSSYVDVYPTQTTGTRVDSESDQVTDGAPSYKVTLQKDITERANVYVNYSSGFRGATFNSISAVPQPVSPEKLKNISAGIKGTFLGNRIRLAVEGFHYDYKNLQVSTIIFAGDPPRSSTVLQNAANAKNDGVDVDIQAEPVRNLTLRAGFEVMNARFTDFPNATISVPLASGGNTTTSGDARGFQLPHAPHFSGNLGASYVIAAAESHFTIAANYNFTGKYSWDTDNRLKQGAYGVCNTSMTWDSPLRAWSVRLWAKNLFDKEYSSYTTANVVGDEETPAPPRTYGLNVSHHFGP